MSYSILLMVGQNNGLLPEADYLTEKIIQEIIFRPVPCIPHISRRHGTSMEPIKKGLSLKDLNP